MSRYEHHLFICQNERTPDDPRGSCRARGADALAEAAKAEVHRLGLKGKARANKAGCLDLCGQGPVCVVYPEGVWYAPRTEDAACADGYDCFRGECVLCPDGKCVPEGVPDECQFIYGYGVPPCEVCADPTYGSESIPCYGVPTGELFCASLLLGESKAQRFAMRIVDAGAAGQGIALASFSLLLLVSLPSASQQAAAQAAQQ